MLEHEGITPRANERPEHYAIKPTPFHGASAGWNATNDWTTAGAFTVSATYSNAAHEYDGIHAFSGLRDLTPVPKYEVHGKRLLQYLSKLITSNVDTWRAGYAYDSLICDENGHVIDSVRIIFDSPAKAYIVSQTQILLWLIQVAEEYDVAITDVTDAHAVLGVYGPRAHDVVSALDRKHLDKLDPDAWTQLQSRDIAFKALIAQDLDRPAIQLWGSIEDAFVLWERVMRAGREVGLRPIGEAVYDQCRIEAGHIRTNVDFISPHAATYGTGPRTPYELHLEDYVDFDGPYFNGKNALIAKRYLQTTKLVGLHITGRRSATGARIIADGRTVGMVTSSTWSPRFMGMIGIATITPRYAVEGTDVSLEVNQTLELQPLVMQRRAVVTALPFK